MSNLVRGARLAFMNTLELAGMVRLLFCGSNTYCRSGFYLKGTNEAFGIFSFGFSYLVFTVILLAFRFTLNVSISAFDSNRAVSILDCWLRSDGYEF